MCGSLGAAHIFKVGLENGCVGVFLEINLKN